MEKQKEVKTHWKKFFNPNYLGAYSLDPGEERILVIDRVQTENVKNSDGKEEEVMVCHFTTGKPMILNKTNAKTIAIVCGSQYVEDWAGKAVQIHVKPVRAFGETVDALRVRSVRPKRDTLNADRFAKMVKAIEAGSYRKDDALNRFALTAEQEAKIKSISEPKKQQA